MNQNLINEVNELIRGYLKKEHTSVSYALMLDGELIVNDSLGTTGGPNPEEATTDCTYNVASVSKIYTSVAVMQLVEKGLLDLDVPLITYLPEFRTINAGYETMTLRQCLSHSCALPGTQWIDFSVADQSEVEYYKEALEFYRNSHLKAAPGRYSVYCNDGFTLAEMCVAAVSEEKSFSEYCRKHITDPIEAWSSRFAGSYNPDYPLIAQGKAPRELVTAQGLGGLTTSMKHLVMFGNQFLPGRPGVKTSILSDESIKEMGKRQGKTFLKKDNSTGSYGLGWDNVNYHHPEYDLGEGAVRKGGASFQFGTNFMIVPQYNAVVAVSQTYDCGLSPRDLSLQILALCLLREKNINISRYKVIPDSMIKKWSGDYVDNNGLFHVSFHGTRMYLFRETSRGKKNAYFSVAGVESSLGYTGREFVSEDGHRILLEQAGGKRYLLEQWLGVTSPMAEQLRKTKELPASWKKRIDKKYINISLTWYEEIVCDMMAGFELKPLGNNPGYLMAVFANGENGVTDCPIRPLSANVATGFLDTPDNASRDLVSPLFRKEKGVEYCTAASYEFCDAAALPIYRGKASCDEAWNEALSKGHSAAIRIDEEQGAAMDSLKDLIPEYRCLLINDDMETVTDSLMKPVNEKSGEPEGFRKLDKGYLLIARKPAQE